MDPSLLPHFVAAGLSLLLADRDRRFHFTSRAIVGLYAVTVARIVSRLPRPDIPERIAAVAAGLQVSPYEGLSRAAWAVDQVLAVTWYAVLSWAVWRGLKDEAPGQSRSSRMTTGASCVCASRSLPDVISGGRWLLYAALAFLASPVPLFFAYPLVRGRPVELASTVVFCVALAVQLAAATRYLQHWRHPDVAQQVALVLVAGSVADAAGPFVLAHPARDWYAGEPVGVLIWTVVGGVALWEIVTTREP
jgi:hypothetical protein